MRIAILGNSGSGKSTLAAALAGPEPVPVLDLDTVAWEPGQTAQPRDEGLSREDVRTFCLNNDSWIVEGCYEALVDTALESGPKLIFLNPGLEVCLENCRSRPWEPHKYSSPEAQDARLQFLMAWVADYYRRTGPLSVASHMACYHAYPGPKREIRVLPARLSMDPELLQWLR